MTHLGMPKEFSEEYVACQSQSSVLSFTERRLEWYVDNLELNDEMLTQIKEKRQNANEKQTKSTT